MKYFAPSYLITASLALLSATGSTLAKAFSTGDIGITKADSTFKLIPSAQYTLFTSEYYYSDIIKDVTNLSKYSYERDKNLRSDRAKRSEHKEPDSLDKDTLNSLFTERTTTPVEASTPGENSTTPAETTITDETNSTPAETTITAETNSTPALLEVRSSIPEANSTVSSTISSQEQTSNQGLWSYSIASLGLTILAVTTMFIKNKFCSNGVQGESNEEMDTFHPSYFLTPVNNATLEFDNNVALMAEYTEDTQA